MKLKNASDVQKDVLISYKMIERKSKANKRRRSTKRMIQVKSTKQKKHKTSPKATIKDWKRGRMTETEELCKHIEVRCSRAN